MGLSERRKIEELKNTTFPARVKEIEEICSYAHHLDGAFADQEICTLLTSKL
jgi:hypothetical protein